MAKDIKKRILQEALMEMERNGPSFRMDDLAHSLNISKRTLYENFSSKQEIIEQLIFAAMDDLYEQHSRLLADPRLTPEEKLSAFFSIRAKDFRVFSAKTTSEFFKKMPGLCDAVHDRSLRDWQLLEKYVKEAQKSNQVKSFDKQLFMFMLHGAAVEIFENVENLENFYSFPECMEECIRILLYGIIKNGGNSTHDDET